MEGEGAGNDGEEFKFEGLGIGGDAADTAAAGVLKSLLKSKWVVCCC